MSNPSGFGREAGLSTIKRIYSLLVGMFRSRKMVGSNKRVGRYDNEREGARGDTQVSYVDGGTSCWISMRVIDSRGGEMHSVDDD